MLCHRLETCLEKKDYWYETFVFCSSGMHSKSSNSAPGAITDSGNACFMSLYSSLIFANFISLFRK